MHASCCVRNAHAPDWPALQQLSEGGCPSLGLAQRSPAFWTQGQACKTHSLVPPYFNFWPG
eukprot:1160180-Pelagomonas_calceolata.AAC.6